MHKKVVKHMAAKAMTTKPCEAKLSEMIHKSKQEDYLEVHFTERVLLCQDPAYHYYVLTHCDETGEMNLYVDKAYNLKDVDWDMRDEVCAEWIKEGTKYEFMATVHVGTGEDAQYRKEIFEEHISQVVGLIMHGDAALLVHYPTLLDSNVSICYHDGMSDCSDIESLGMVKDHLHTSIKK